MSKTELTSVSGTQDEYASKPKFLRESGKYCTTCENTKMMVRAIIDHYSMQLECPNCGYGTSCPWDGVPTNEPGK